MQPNFKDIRQGWRAESQIDTQVYHSESDVQKAIVQAAIKSPRVAWISRNNVGSYRASGRTITYGLGKGSSDLIGQLTDGRFLAVEVKHQGQPSDEQILFVNRIKMHGGCAGVCWSVADLERLVGV